MPVRAVLDTSIYVSALVSASGWAGKVFEAGFRTKVFTPVASPAILGELIDVITRPEKLRLFDRTLTELAAFHLFVKQHAELVAGDYQGLELVPTDAKDNPVAAAAVEGQVPYLVALDARDLLPLKVFLVAGHAPVQVVEPRDFLREVLHLN